MSPRIADPLLHIALFEPLIPQNTGNIGRLATANRLPLHLVEPLGFSLDEKRVRRAGLDYWVHADVRVHADFPSLRRAIPEQRLVAFAVRAPRLYSDFAFRPGDCLLFGRETTGLPESILEDPNIESVRLPMRSPIVRSLNLANSVAIGLYEALRQLGFPDALKP